VLRQNKMIQGTPKGEATMNKGLISRRHVLAGSAAAGLFGLTAPRAHAAEVNWKKYAGTTLEANLVKGPRGELLQKYSPTSPASLSNRKSSRSSSSGKRP
jgi:hypothetical protein